MGFGRAVLGYPRAEVEQRLAALQEEVERERRELESAAARIAEMEARAEEREVAIAALRRQRAQVEGHFANTNPVVVMIGPVAALQPLVELIDDLEEAPGLSIQFRIFRDGFYRVDGYASDAAALRQWFEVHPRVRSAVFENGALYIAPKGGNV